MRKFSDSVFYVRAIQAVEVSNSVREWVTGCNHWYNLQPAVSDSRKMQSNSQNIPKTYMNRNSTVYIGEVAVQTQSTLRHYECFVFLILSSAHTYQREAIKQEVGRNISFEVKCNTSRVYLDLIDDTFSACDINTIHILKFGVSVK